MRYSDLDILTESSNHVLFEGVKIGQKEIEETLDNSSEFQMGIEYEVMIPNNGSLMGAKQFIDDNNIKYITEIKPEHDNMTEIITSTMPIPVGLSHIKNFFEKAKANGITFPSTAGLHISISHKHYDKKDVNLTKFLVLLSGDYLHSLFPEREYVKNISSRIRTILLTNKAKTVHDMEELIVSQLTDEDGNNQGVKHITAKISDYINMDGRIELRYFGGENYNEQFNEIRWQVLRAIYVLAVAYEPNMYRKEYLKTLYSYTQRTPLPADYDLTGISPSSALELLRRYGDNRLTKIISSSAQHSYQYAYRIIKDRFPNGEDAIGKDNQFSFLYAKNVLNGRFEKGEDVMSIHTYTAFKYALFVLEGRFEQGEEAIAENAELSYRYANEVLNGRFEKGEVTIATSASESFRYARYILNDRFKRGELTIADDPEYSYQYANEVIGGRFIKGENAIAQLGWTSFEYATQIIKGRFESGERVMSEEIDEEQKKEYYELTGIEI